MSKIIVNYTLNLGTMADKVALGKARQDSNTTFERLTRVRSYILQL